MSYLQRLKNKNMPTIGTAKTVKSTIDPLFAVNAVPTLSIVQETETSSCSFCSAHPEHISENEITSQEVKETRPSLIDGLHPCPLCGGVLFNEGSRGGYFCVVCQGMPEGASVVRVVQGITPRKAKKVYPEPEPSHASQKNKRGRPSSIAMAWLLEYRQALDKAGWTRAELYRHNKRQGIAWLKLWARPDLQVSLAQPGSIIFSFTTATGNQITQTAFPRRDKKS